MRGYHTPYRQLLLTYLKPQGTRVVVLAALLLSSAGLQLANPQIARYFIDTARAGGALHTLTLAAALFLGLALLTQAVGVAETYAAENLGWTATNALRADLTQHCLELDLSFHHVRTPGELIERVDGDVTTLANFFSRFVLQLLGSLVLLLGVLVLLFREDWRIGAVTLACSAVALAVLNGVRGFGARYALASRQASADLFGFLEERLAGLVDIQANGAQPYIMARSYHYSRALFHRARAAFLINSLLGGATGLVFTLALVLVLGLGATFFRAGTLSLGTVYLLFQYLAMVRQPLREITRQAQDFQNASASIARVQQLYDTPRAIVDGSSAILPPGPLGLAFHGVSFQYPPHPDSQGDAAPEPALRGISFALAPGTVLGLLGRTGSGKTTLGRLALRLYDPNEGTIRLGGVDLRDLRLADLYERVAIVTQDVQVFAATVRDNLTVFNPQIPDERAVWALREIGLGTWYAALPAGLDTVLGPGGTGVSAGEAQLLAFARVLPRDPSLIILDEASSRLDPATEQLIERAVDRLLHGRTAIVIAHRLATIQRAGAIVILDDGQICEHGPREQLARDPASRFSQLLQTGRLG